MGLPLGLDINLSGTSLYFTSSDGSIICLMLGSMLFTTLTFGNIVLKLKL